MKSISRRELIGVIAGTLGALLLVPGATSKSHPAHPYRYSVVDMPVSLAVGTVRTPEFAPPLHWYWIMLQVEKPPPFRDMQCMTGVKDGTNDFAECAKEPLIDADWKVLSDGQVVDHGSSSSSGDAKFTTNYIFKFLGSFSTLPGKKYVLEVNFTKDGTPLNVANPHLIVTEIGYE
jgi:hypothetical protein